MTTKLNLTVNENTAKAIKAYAEKKKTSVSKLAEEYFSKLAGDDVINKNQQKSFVEKYAGIATKKLKDIDALKDDFLKEKYGL
ncbi:DUF6364 family protein [uncultured Mucilaginibacter sp.]|uniref:DUF6364 family protein n=1 Tax=uncultured Mucilaginibacter sp. TaxID=797541 RepID=UPI0026118271|nr:DUF6364 family protein [uncultured Mucilaginibacter sp.]